MSRSNTIDKHFVLATIPAFNHVRPAVSIAYKLVTRDPSFVITIFSAKFLVPVYEQEVARASLSPEATSRVRVIGVGNMDTPPKDMDYIEAIPRLFGALGADSSAGYEALVNGSALTCTATGRVYSADGLPAPSVALVDNLLPVLPQTVKKLTPHATLLFLWITAPCSLVSHYGPAKYGGTLELEADNRDALERGDLETVGKAIFDVLGASKGVPYPNPEGVKMFDYEMVPQGAYPVRIPLSPLVLFPSIRSTNEVSDGVLVTSIRAFQPNVTRAVRDWYEAPKGRKVFYIGPQALPSNLSRDFSVVDPADPFAHIFQFLNSHPARSVILISFGTLFYPAEDPWRIEAIVSTLLDTRTPFIVSRAAMMAKEFSPALEARLLQCKDVALVVPQNPQAEMLAHPSMAAFLTHGGINSMHESIMAGVTNIFWPMTADQPLHAGYMSENLDCAFELLQVRTGAGAGPPMRGGKIYGTPEAVAEEFKGVLEDLKGPVGERKLKNLLAIREQFREAMKEGGEVDTDLAAILNLGRKDSTPSLA